MTDRCPDCLLKRERCLCAEIPRVANRTHVAVVMHELERWRSSNSGRLAARALTASSIHMFGAPDVALDEEALVEPGSWLLFPEGPTLAAPPEEPPRRLIALDATWGQARKMRQRIGALRGLPILSLPPASRERMRIARRAGELATLEAIALALGMLEGPAVRDRLLALYDLAVVRTVAGRRGGSGGG